MQTVSSHLSAVLVRNRMTRGQLFSKQLCPLPSCCLADLSSCCSNDQESLQQGSCCESSAAIADWISVMQQLYSVSQLTNSTKWTRAALCKMANSRKLTAVALRTRVSSIYGSADSRHVTAAAAQQTCLLFADHLIPAVEQLIPKLSSAVRMTVQFLK